MRAAALAVAALALCAGCDGADDRPARWSYLYPAIIEPSCTTAGCHSKMTAQAGVDLSTREGGYVVLVGRICGQPPQELEPPPGNYVFPFAPERSRLLYLLRGDDVPRRMPPDTALPEVEIDLLERWILEGAPCD